jgi:hypothetical protein
MPLLQLMRPGCSRFITPGLEAEIYWVIERLINTIGSPQIAIDERHTPKLYSRFLASLLAKHKRDGAAHGRMHQQGPPTQSMQPGSNALVYQPPLRPPQGSHGASMARFCDRCRRCERVRFSSVYGTERRGDDSEQSDGEEELGRPRKLHVDVSPDFTFGVADHQQGDLMDFTFDPITSPGNEVMLAAMQGIQSLTWLGNMLMPGSVVGDLHVVPVELLLTYRFFWPQEEIQDHSAIGNGMANDNYQNFQVQPTEVLLR